VITSSFFQKSLGMNSTSSLLVSRYENVRALVGEAEILLSVRNTIVTTCKRIGVIDYTYY
jgi:hypothetical protein